MHIREMRSETMAAFKQRDAANLERLLDEITTQSWQTEVPQDFRRFSCLQKASIPLASLATDHLHGLLNALTSAQAAGSYGGSRPTLMTQWRQVESEQLSLPAKFQQQVRPVAAWLSSEERRRGVTERMKSIQPILRDEIRRERRVAAIEPSQSLSY